MVTKGLEGKLYHSLVFFLQNANRSKLISYYSQLVFHVALSLEVLPECMIST